jgi:hypothetical protein
VRENSLKLMADAHRRIAHNAIQTNPINEYLKESKKLEKQNRKKKYLISSAIHKVYAQEVPRLSTAGSGEEAASRNVENSTGRG